MSSNPAQKAPKAAVVTGASSGIGLAISKMLLASNYNVVGLARFQSNAPLDHPLFKAHPCDLTDMEKLEALVKALSKRYPNVDCLILNAGKMLFGTVEQLSLRAIEDNLRLNLLSAIAVSKAFLPAMKRRKQGRILFMGSECALKGSNGASAYAAGKFGLRGFAQALRDECKKDGISVTEIHPGLVRTPFFHELNFQPADGDLHAMEADDIAKLVMAVLTARPGTSIDQITVNPQLSKIKKIF